MATFTTAKLTNHRVLVRGTDSFGTEGETVLDGEQWADVTAHLEVDTATEEFDAAVNDFFAPLLQATEVFEAKRAAADEPDPSTYVVLHEGTPAVQGRDEIRVALNSDSIVLRLIEAGDFDRLVWVADKLEVLEVLPGTTPAASVTSGDPHANEDQLIES